MQLVPWGWGIQGYSRNVKLVACICGLQTDCFPNLVQKQAAEERIRNAVSICRIPLARQYIKKASYLLERRSFLFIFVYFEFLLRVFKHSDLRLYWLVLYRGKTWEIMIKSSSEFSLSVLYEKCMFQNEQFLLTTGPSSPFGPLKEKETKKTDYCHRYDNQNNRKSKLSLKWQVDIFCCR